ncbi:MAG: hypothetical protein N3F05_01665 [Candidatus Diapherotrites archaeon]|nr:hypothetical protein [Candidatus Diapherotrites archaeon]
MGIQDIILPFTRKSDLEKKKEEMRKAIGLFSNKGNTIDETKELERLAEEIRALESKSQKKDLPKKEQIHEEIDFKELEIEKNKPKKAVPEPKEEPLQVTKRMKGTQPEENAKKEIKAVEAPPLENKALEVRDKGSAAVQKEDFFGKQLPVFYFWYCDLKAGNLAEFEQAIAKAPINSVEHHASNHDFSNWLSSSMPEYFITPLKAAEGRKGEDIRKAILELISGLRRNFKEPQLIESKLVSNQKSDKKQLKEPIFSTF